MWSLDSGLTGLLILITLIPVVVLKFTCLLLRRSDSLWLSVCSSGLRSNQSNTKCSFLWVYFLLLFVENVWLLFCSLDICPLFEPANRLYLYCVALCFGCIRIGAAACNVLIIEAKQSLSGVRVQIYQHRPSESPVSWTVIIQRWRAEPQEEEMKRNIRAVIQASEDQIRRFSSQQAPLPLRSLTGLETSKRL